MVNGSWVLASVKSTPSGVAGQWVGIGGTSPGLKGIIQVGTISISANGTTGYAAWYAGPPDLIGRYINSTDQGTNFTVNPGDTIVASVSCAASCSTSSQRWSILIKDVALNETFTTTWDRFNPDTFSAEWIIEAPSSVGPVNPVQEPLANFGTAYFGPTYTNQTSTDYATVVGITGPISRFPNFRIRMANGSLVGFRTLADTSALTGNGTSFSIQWRAPRAKPVFLPNVFWILGLGITSGTLMRVRPILAKRRVSHKTPSLTVTQEAVRLDSQETPVDA